MDGVAYASLDWGDYDGDGRLDLIVAGSGANDTFDIGVLKTKVYRNEGGGHFESVGADLQAVKRASIDWGDYDGDGELDLAIAGDKNSDFLKSAKSKNLMTAAQDRDATPTTKIYHNGGNGSFELKEVGVVGVYVGSVGGLQWRRGARFSCCRSYECLLR